MVTPAAAGQLFCTVQTLLLGEAPAFAKLLQAPTAPPAGAAPPAAASPAIAVNGLSWSYRGGGGGGKNALRDVNFELPKGARCLLVGANGAGKTTPLDARTPAPALRASACPAAALLTPPALAARRQDDAASAAGRQAHGAPWLGGGAQHSMA